MARCHWHRHSGTDSTDSTLHLADVTIIARAQMRHPQNIRIAKALFHRDVATLAEVLKSLQQQQAPTNTAADQEKTFEARLKFISSLDESTVSRLSATLASHP
jgi:hypothetical protein